MVELARIGRGRGSSERHPRLTLVLNEGVATQLNRHQAAHGPGYVSAGSALGWPAPANGLDDRPRLGLSGALAAVEHRRFGEALALASSYTHIVAGTVSPPPLTRSGLGPRPIVAPEPDDAHHWG